MERTGGGGPYKAICSKDDKENKRPKREETYKVEEYDGAKQSCRDGIKHLTERKTEREIEGCVEKRHREQSLAMQTSKEDSDQK